MKTPINPEDVAWAFGAAPKATSNSLLDGLNPAQRKAVETTDGPLVIRAGAGTGKTTVLTRRISHIIEQGKARPEQILAVTFTKKAAGEMRSRLGGLLGDHIGRAINVGNFHSISSEILRRYSDLVDLPNRFVILDEDGQKEVIADKAMARGFLTSRKDKTLIYDFLSQVASWKEDGYDVAQVLSAPDLSAITTSPKQDDPNFLAQAATVFADYQEELARCRWCDFADLILHTVRILRTHPEIREREAGRFTYVMADEFQDTSPVQNEWLTLMAKDHRNICVVGDTDQSIYEWRNARPEIMMNFSKVWKDCQEITIDINYRSTQEILRVANVVVEPLRARDGLDKELKSPRSGITPSSLFEVYGSGMDEAAAIARDIETKIDNGEKPSEIAVLCRSGMIITGIERALRDRRIRYTVAGAMKFTDREEIKDAIAYLELAVNPMHYIAFERIARKPTRNIGQTKISEIRHEMTQSRSSLSEAVAVVASRIKNQRTKAAQALHQFRDQVLMIEKTAEGAESAGHALADILQDTGYMDWRRGNDRDPQRDQRLENLEHFIDEAGNHPRIIDFLETMALQAGGDTSWGDDTVVISTIHASKGLEFDIVYTPAMEEGVFPNARSEMTSYGADEERRLAHVAWTRARLELHISCAGFRIGRQGTSYPSRYLSEIGMPVHSASGGYSKSLAPTPKRTAGASYRFRSRY